MLFIFHMLGTSTWESRLNVHTVPVAMTDCYYEQHKEKPNSGILKIRAVFLIADTTKQFKVY